MFSSLSPSQTLTSALPLLPFVMSMPSAPILVGLIVVHARVDILAMGKLAQVGLGFHFTLARSSFPITY